MANTYLCNFDSCADTDTRIVISDQRSEQRVRFCSYAHAIGWLLRQIEIRGEISESAQLAIQGIVRVTGPRFDGKPDSAEFGMKPETPQKADRARGIDPTEAVRKIRSRVEDRGGEDPEITLRDVHQLADAAI